MLSSSEAFHQNYQDISRVPQTIDSQSSKKLLVILTISDRHFLDGVKP